jgi:flagellar basal body P-ring formation protein FlgA
VSGLVRRGHGAKLLLARIAFPLAAGALVYVAQAKGQDAGGVIAPAPAMASVDVLAHPVARGAMLSMEDFTSAQVQAPLARTALRARDVAGQEAKRSLVTGAIVRAGDVGPRPLVRRGEGVTLTLNTGRLTISAPGRALDDGGAGAGVRVVNLATGHTLDGRVAGMGQVEIAAP